VPNLTYAGASARTRKAPVVFSCSCGERFAVQVFRAVDSEARAETVQLLEGTLNRVRCPACDHAADVQVPVLYHDLSRRRLVLVLPQSQRHRELDELGELFRTLAADAEPPPGYVLDAKVVFGAVGLREALETADAPGGAVGHPLAPTARVVASTSSLAPEATPVDPVPALAAHARPAHPTVAMVAEPAASNSPTVPIPIAAPAREPSAEPRALARAVRTPSAEDTHPRAMVNVPDPHSAVIERWIAGRDGPAALFVEDRTIVCASLPSHVLESFVPGALELRVQLHRLPNFPVIALTLVTEEAARAAARGQRVDDAKLLSVALDISRAAHRVILEALAQRTALSLELYDPQYLPVVSHEISASLEENVRLLMAEAKEALDRLPPATRSFDRARTTFQSSTYDRLGRTPIDLPDGDLTQLLDKPRAVRIAASQVARWSEPAAEGYLLEIRALPLKGWQRLRATVVRRALDLGLMVPRSLVERAAKDAGTDPQPWEAVVELMVRRFSEIAAGLKPNDLQPAEEAANWENLLREANQLGLSIDAAVQRLADAVIRKVRPSQDLKSQLQKVPPAGLVELLERKEQRREAAVVLCGLGDAKTLPAIFAALRKMPRAEANVVLPAVTGFGPAAEKWLIEGLKSKKSFMRQGCALALGALKTPLAVDALSRALTAEPTEIWSEVARALGDVGAQAVMPLAARLREVDGERRERIIRALAHIVARGVKAPLEMLASGRDLLVAAAAREALMQAPEVRTADEALRTGGRDVTVVRGFTRRFYDALEGDVELSPADLEEIDAAGPDLEEVLHGDGEVSDLEDHDDAGRIPTRIVDRAPRRGAPLASKPDLPRSR
jgi:HEAT repeat protein